MVITTIHHTKVPNHVPFCVPMKSRMAPGNPFRVALPIQCSAIIRQSTATSIMMIYATTNAPPPFVAATRGNLQIFPVPTDAAIIAIAIATGDEKPSFLFSFSFSMPSSSNSCFYKRILLAGFSACGGSL